MRMNSRQSISLNGKWKIVFDKNNIGKQKRWFQYFPKSTDDITVPGVWEQINPNYDGVGWYKKEFTVMQAWQNKQLRLHFSAVHYFCEVWINGTFIGSHEGGGTPFEFNITNHITIGQNNIILRVINPPMDREIDGFRAGAPLNQSNIPTGKAGWYYNYGGIWQDVQLIITDDIYIDNIYIQPYPQQKKVIIQATIQNCGKKTEQQINYSIYTSKRKKSIITKTVTLNLKNGKNPVKFPVTFENFNYWTPDSPFLYTATVSTGNDQLSARFGMREFTIKNGHFYLNGKRITLKGYLQQGSYPKTLIFPHSEEMTRKELKLVKKSGCNFIRAHLKAPNPHWLDLCDEMGILIEGEPGIGWVANSPETKRRCQNEIEGLILRDRNHPCIIMWCLMNEAYHFLGFTMPQIKRLTAELAAIGRKLDNTRLLMDTSGGGGGNNITGATQVLLPHINRKVNITDDHAYCNLPLQYKELANYRTSGKKGIPLFISEFGAPLIPPNHKQVLNSYTPSEKKIHLEDYQLHKDFYDSLKQKFKNAGLKPIFGTADNFVEKIDDVRSEEIKLITTAQRCNNTLAGTALCQLADASGELFGATDFFRNPKKLYFKFKDAIQTPLAAPEIYPAVSCPGDKISIRFSAIFEDQQGVIDKYKLVIISDAGKKLVTVAEEKVKAEQYIQTLHISKQILSLPPGQYKLRGYLLKKDKIKNQSDIQFTVIPPPFIDRDKIALYDPSGILWQYLKTHKIKIDAFGNNYRNKNIPILMNMGTGRIPLNMLYEEFQQLRKIAETGGVGILFTPQPMLLYEYLLPSLIRPATDIMRTMGYIKEHPVFNNLPSNCVADYIYADVMTDTFDIGEDIAAAGGNVIAGGLSAHMWTRPAKYTWGASMYSIPVGKGEIIVSHFNIIDTLKSNRVAQMILCNMINYANSRIKSGGEELLLSRCIDPIK